MFPPETVGVIGNQGMMAKNVAIPFFEKTGCRVIGSDIKNPQGSANEDVVREADVVYFSIFPFDAVAKEISRLIPFAKLEGLWLHGTSIQNPVCGPITPVLNSPLLTEKKVDTGFLHFVFGPTVRSMRGQSVVYGFSKPLMNQLWEEWLIRSLEPARPRVIKYTPDYHDELTDVSQWIPMFTALFVSGLWLKQKASLPEALSMAGPPCWLQAYGVLRNLTQPGIIASIIANHPSANAVLAQAKELLLLIDEACRNGNELALVEMAKNGSSAVSSFELARIRELTDWHARLEGDMRGGAVCFRFLPDKNVRGLLTKVLAIFDHEGFDKTSCMAQELPDGGCVFYIGVKIDVDDPRVRAAVNLVVREFGAEVVSSEKV